MDITTLASASVFVPQPHDWHSRGIGRTMPLALPESPHIWRALHSPRDASGAVVIDGVVLHLWYPARKAPLECPSRGPRCGHERQATMSDDIKV